MATIHESTQIADGLSRRRFLARAGLVAGAGAIAPFTFVRNATATGSTVPMDLDGFIRSKLREAGVPSMSFSVVKDDQVVWAGGYGWANIEDEIAADANTVYMLASVSKTMTCAGVMRLVQDGLLDLDADVNDYLPYSVRVPAAPDRKITLRQLLTHTSAIRDRYSVWGTLYSDPSLYFHGDSPIGLREFEQSYLEVGGSEYQASNFFDRPPGAAYAYCNIAVALAGAIAEEVSGVDFDQWCKQEIMGPLGMTNSGFRLADISTPNLAMPYKILRPGGGFEPYFQYGYPDYPDGALRTSAEHLARWLGAFIQFGEFQGVRVLDEATVRETRRNQLAGITSWRQGLIWYCIRSGAALRMGHTGGDYGVSTRMFFQPRSGVGVVSLTNASIGGSKWKAFRDVEHRLFDIFA